MDLGGIIIIYPSLSCGNIRMLIFAEGKITRGDVSSKSNGSFYSLIVLNTETIGLVSALIGLIRSEGLYNSVYS